LLCSIGLISSSVPVYYLNKLFDSDHVLSLKFHKKLAQNLAQRFATLTFSGRLVASNLRNRLRNLPLPGRGLVPRSSENEANSTLEPGKASRSKKKEKTGVDHNAKFREKFNITGEDVLVKSFEVSIRKAHSKFSSKLFVSSNNLCWQAHVFGVSMHVRPASFSPFAKLPSSST
jgi:hypothetical protein